MSHFAEKLPYEELDPCCQQEIDENIKYNEVTRTLRKNDRTVQRLDERKNAVKSLRSFKCECCKLSKDYPILAKLRALSIPKVVESNSNEEDDDLQDDSDDDFDSEFLTPYEQERLNQVKAQIERLEQAKSMGFATHIEDSLDHVWSYIRSTSTPIVLHLYDPNSSLCGALDLALENLAPRYVGTKFRRITYSPYLIEHPLFKEFGHVMSNIHASDAQHALLCIVGKTIVAHSYSFAEFSDLHESTVHSSDLEKYLDHAHALSSALSPEDMKYYRSNEEGDYDEEEGENPPERNTYCDDPDCTRYFPHEHIGAASSAASFARVNQKGDEALATNAFRTV